MRISDRRRKAVERIIDANDESPSVEEIYRRATEIRAERELQHETGNRTMGLVRTATPAKVRLAPSAMAKIIGMQ